MSRARIVGERLFQVGEELVQRAIIVRVNLVLALRVVIIALAVNLVLATIVIVFSKEVF